MSLIDQIKQIGQITSLQQAFAILVLIKYDDANIDELSETTKHSLIDQIQANKAQFTSDKTGKVIKGALTKYIKIYNTQCLNNQEQINISNNDTQKITDLTSILQYILKQPPIIKQEKQELNTSINEVQSGEPEHMSIDDMNMASFMKSPLFQVFMKQPQVMKLMYTLCSKCSKCHDKDQNCDNNNKSYNVVQNEQIACIRGCGVVHEESRSCEDIQLLREYKVKFPVLQDILGRTVMSVEIDILAIRIREMVTPSIETKKGYKLYHLASIIIQEESNTKIVLYINYTGKESGYKPDLYRINLHRIDIIDGKEEKVKFKEFLITYRGGTAANMKKTVNTYTYALWFLHSSIIELILQEIENLFPIREEYLELINYKKYSEFHEKLESNFICLFSSESTTTNVQNMKLNCKSDNFFITMNQIRVKAQKNAPRYTDIEKRYIDAHFRILRQSVTQQANEGKIPVNLADPYCTELVKNARIKFQYPE